MNSSNSIYYLTSFNYYTIRIIVFMILIILVFIYNKKSKTKNNNKYEIKKKVFSFLLLLMIIIIIFIIPYEYKFIRFKNLKKAFNYYYPTKEIIYEYGNSQYKFIVTKDKNTSKYDLISFMSNKNNKNWHPSNNFILFDITNSKKRGYVKQSYYTNIYENENKQEKKKAILITYVGDYKNSNITDSLNSKFIVISDSKNEEPLKGLIYLKIINIDKNYKIFINKDEYLID